MSTYLLISVAALIVFVPGCKSFHINMPRLPSAGAGGVQSYQSVYYAAQGAVLLAKTAAIWNRMKGDGTTASNMLSLSFVAQCSLKSNGYALSRRLIDKYDSEVSKADDGWFWEVRGQSLSEQSWSVEGDLQAEVNHLLASAIMSGCEIAVWEVHDGRSHATYSMNDMH